MALSTSIAMCTYNGACYLSQQLQSFLDQNVLPNELIVCDDASRDNTVQILETFAQKAPFPVRIVQNPRNLGYVRNFEQAVSLCTQEVILMCDQDDVWLPHKIQTLLQVFEQESEVGLVMHDFERIDAIGSPYLELNERYGVERIDSSQLEKNVRSNSIMVFMRPYPRAWYGCMMAFRSQYLSLLLPIYPGKGHDDWILKLLAPITEVRFVSQVLMKYRIHSRNSNSHEVGHSRVKISLIKAKKRWIHIFKGYSKKNFYKQLLLRLDEHSITVRRPELIKIYREYI